MSTKNIWEASKKGDLDRVKHLVDVENINVDIINEDSVIKLKRFFYFCIYLIFQDGDTPLICASQFGHLNIIEYLIQKGVDVNLQDRVFLII